jgi:transcription initiation factor TFIIH subunit 2
VGAEIASPSADSRCFSCRSLLYNTPEAGAAAARQDIVLECTKCKQPFCAECDMYIHETLHNCPGCEMVATVVLAAAG